MANNISGLKGKTHRLNTETMDQSFKRIILLFPHWESRILSFRRAITLYFSKWLSAYKQRPDETDNQKAFARAEAFIMEAYFDNFNGTKVIDLKKLGEATEEDCETFEFVKANIPDIYVHIS